MNTVDSEVLKYIKTYQKTHLLAPRLNQIRRSCNLTSAGICWSLRRLVEAGLVEIKEDNINGLQIIASGLTGNSHGVKRNANAEDDIFLLPINGRKVRL